MGDAANIDRRHFFCLFCQDKTLRIKHIFLKIFIVLEGIVYKITTFFLCYYS